MNSRTQAQDSSQSKTNTRLDQVPNKNQKIIATQQNFQSKANSTLKKSTEKSQNAHQNKKSTSSTMVNGKSNGLDYFSQTKNLENQFASSEDTFHPNFTSYLKNHKVNQAATLQACKEALEKPVLESKSNTFLIETQTSLRNQETTVLSQQTKIRYSVGDSGRKLSYQMLPKSEGSSNQNFSQEVVHRELSQNSVNNTLRSLKSEQIQTQLSKIITRHNIVNESYKQSRLQVTQIQQQKQEQKTNQGATNNQTQSNNQKNQPHQKNSRQQQDSIQIDNQQLQPPSREPSQMGNRRDRSESRQRRKINGEAILKECANIQDLVKTSVQNINKIIFEVKDNQAFENGTSIQNAKLRKIHSSPSRKGIQGTLGSISVIQRFFRTRINRQKTLRKIKCLKNFRKKILALYKGWVLRNKIMKSFQIRQVIKDIKSLKNKQAQMNNSVNKLNPSQQNSIKNHIRDKTQQLIDKINDMMSHKKPGAKTKMNIGAESQYYSGGGHTSQGKATSKNQQQQPIGFQTPTQLSARVQEESTKPSPSKTSSQPQILKIASTAILNSYYKMNRGHQMNLISPKSKEQMPLTQLGNGHSSSLISNESSQNELEREEGPMGTNNTLAYNTNDVSEGNQTQHLNLEQYQQSPKTMFSNQEKIFKQIEQEIQMGRMNQLRESNSVIRQNSIVFKQVTLDQKESFNNRTATPKQAGSRQSLGKINANSTQVTGRKSAVNKQIKTEVKKNSQRQNSKILNQSNNKTKAHLNSDLDIVEASTTSKQRDTSKNRASYNKTSSKIDCWRKEETKQLIASEFNPNTPPPPFNVNTMIDQTKMIEISSEVEYRSTSPQRKKTMSFQPFDGLNEQSELPEVERILQRMREIMMGINHNELSKDQRKQQKIQMEKCFLEMRKEFDVKCLEKYGEIE